MSSGNSKNVDYVDLLIKIEGLDFDIVQDAPPISPSILADLILMEVENRLGVRALPNRDVFFKAIVKRADIVYRSNLASDLATSRSWAKKVRAKNRLNGLGFLKGFMRHWLAGEFFHTPPAGWLKISDYDRARFANGEPF